MRKTNSRRFGQPGWVLSAILVFCLSANAQEPAAGISAEFPFESKYVEVLGARIHYIEEGEGDPVLFIHGNPTSSYLWRNVIPYVAADHRAIAIDLIGMGKSDKPEIAYTYLDHRRYVDGFIEALGLTEITFVIHDWGTVLGFDYAMRNEEYVRAIAFLEPLLPPRFPIANEPSADSIFGQFRTAGVGERLIYEEHYFVEQMLPGGVIRQLTEEEMERYREPYREEGTRKPVLQWPRELPMGGVPAANAEIISAIGEWMRQTDMPMLYFWAKPGPNSTLDGGAYYVENVPNIESVFLGVGGHYLQEDHPEKIGRSVDDWLRRIESGSQ